MAAGKGRPLGEILLTVLMLLGATVVSGNFTLSLKNDCSNPMYPILISADGSLILNSSTVIGPSGTLQVSLPGNWSGLGYMRTGCIPNGGGFNSCIAGECKGNDCAENGGPFVTYFYISSGSFAVSVEKGFNVGIAMDFLCNGCNCQSTGCKAQLESCPKEWRINNSEGVAAACKPASGLQFSGDQCIVDKNYASAPRHSITCSQDSLAVEVTMSC